MKKRVAFFAHRYISHIKPLESLIKKLNKEDIEVYIFNIKENKQTIENMGAKLIEYPNDFFKDKLSDYRNKLKLDAYKDLELKNLYGFFYNFFKIDISLSYSSMAGYDNYFKKKLVEYGINKIFSDSVICITDKISEEMNLINIKYVTNNLYPLQYILEENERIDLFFLRAFKKNSKFYNYFYKELKKDFFEFLSKINNDIARELNMNIITLYPQHNINGYLNIIFSNDYLQPKINFKNKILIDNRSENLLNKNNKISNNLHLKEYIKKNKDKKIIYISTGSFLKRNINFYLKILEVLFQDKNICCVVSCNDIDYIKTIKSKYNDSKLYINTFIDQIYVLKNANLFISSGGINSITEALNFKVPLIIIPFSAEQYLNGYLIEKLNLGKLVSINKIIKFDILSLVQNIMNNKEIKKSLEEIKPLNIKENEKNINKIIKFINS